MPGHRAVRNDPSEFVPITIDVVSVAKNEQIFFFQYTIQLSSPYVPVVLPTNRFILVNSGGFGVNPALVNTNSYAFGRIELFDFAKFDAVNLRYQNVPPPVIGTSGGTLQTFDLPIPFP